MTSRATVEVADAERLVRQMGRHFAHKVSVEEDGDRRVVAISAGRFELEPRGEAIEIRVEAADAAGRARVEEVCASHLARFAHAELAFDWSRGD